MTATELKRPASAVFASVVLAGMAAALATGPARAQTVNPVPPPPPPSFNNTPSQPAAPAPVPQVSPLAPGGISGSSATPGPELSVPPITSPRRTTCTPDETTPHVSRTYAHNYGRPHSHHVRYARVLGPSYYPGLGLVYPPYANPCHFRPTWYAYYGEWLSYGCGW